MSKARARNDLAYAATVAAGWLLRFVPRRVVLFLGRLVGELVFRLDTRHRNITIENLDGAFGGSKTDREKWAIARGTFRHFGGMIFELVGLGRATRRQIEKIVEFEGLENFEQARAAGKGVLLVAAHFGNWEVHAIAHGYRLGPLAVVARLQDNPHYNKLLEKIRTASGNTVLYKHRALARMMRLLKDGETVAVLIDQNVAREDGLFVEFFGRKAATTPVASWLALKTGAALVPVFTLPLADGRYRLIYETPVDARAFSALPRQEAAQALTQECARVLEGFVRRNPEYWLWMHRRWKTRPAEEPSAEESWRREEVG